MKRHLALIGFMAAGKTTVGRRLAAELGVPFVDTDAAIVARYGSIAEIFAREGEAGFRARELAAVEAALDGPAAVIALGGGAVTHEPTRALVAARALRVFLDVPLATLVGRLRRTPTLRPVIGAAPTPARVEGLLAARAPLYREADIVVRASGGSASSLARRIARRVGRSAAGEIFVQNRGER